jgi:hypothetical protein
MVGSRGLGSIDVAVHNVTQPLWLCDRVPTQPGRGQRRSLSGKFFRNRPRCPSATPERFDLNDTGPAQLDPARPLSCTRARALHRGRAAAAVPHSVDGLAEAGGPVCQSGLPHPDKGRGRSEVLLPREHVRVANPARLNLNLQVASGACPHDEVEAAVIHLGLHTSKPACVNAILGEYSAHRPKRCRLRGSQVQVAAGSMTGRLASPASCSGPPTASPLAPGRKTVAR